jgi:predicted CXXCH cytochrome family protein
MDYAKIILAATALAAHFLSGPWVEWGRAQTALPGVPTSQQQNYADCQQCHDYEQNHHPVNFKPLGEIPLPLSDGNITCTTCHNEDHRSGGDNYLRGGPYRQSREICFKCHQPPDYAGVNAHVMLDEAGKVKTIIGGLPVCRICHVDMPDPEVDRSEDVQFRAGVGFLCWRCHQPMANARLLDEHFRVEPPKQMLPVIEKNEKAMNVLLPMVPRGRITCSTCHNPHQQGVIRREAAAKGADSPERLRIPSPRLCFVCHPL